MNVQYTILKTRNPCPVLDTVYTIFTAPWTTMKKALHVMQTDLGFCRFVCDPCVVWSLDPSYSLTVKSVVMHHVHKLAGTRQWRHQDIKLRGQDLCKTDQSLHLNYPPILHPINEIEAPPFSYFWGSITQCFSTAFWETTSVTPHNIIKRSLLHSQDLVFTLMGNVLH